MFMGIITIICVMTKNAYIGRNTLTVVVVCLEERPTMTEI